MGIVPVAPSDRLSFQRGGGLVGKTRSRRILLVDDHAVLRHGVRALIDEHIDWKVCGEAADGQEAVEKALELKPDLIVMDIGLPVMNGLDATREIKRVLPATKIVVFTMHDSRVIAEQARRAGAERTVVKGGSLDDLTEALVAMLDGKQRTQ